MSYIRSIATNIKSPDGKEHTIDLAKNTVLIGPNESGKSAIAESVQLARTGSAFGLLYRDKPIKDGKLLSALIPFGEQEARVEAVLDSGETCGWSLQQGKRPEKWGVNGAVLSSAEIHSVIAGNAETLAKFFWSHLCESVPAATLRQQVPIEHQEAFSMVVSEDAVSIDMVDLVIRIGKTERDQASAAKASKMALASLGSVRQVSEDELEGIWDTLERAMTRDLTKIIYEMSQRDPGLQGTNTVAELVKNLGGKESIQRIPETGEVVADFCESLLQNRLCRIAIAAQGGASTAVTRQENLCRLRKFVLEEIVRQVAAKIPAFGKRVSAFLPKGEKLHVDISDSQLITLSIARGEEIHTALSGSTEARLIAALGAALANSDDHLLVVDDRMWDAGTLAKTLGALEKAPCQVIVMSTVRPKGKKRANWSYLEIERGDSLTVTAE